MSSKEENKKGSALTGFIWCLILLLITCLSAYGIRSLAKEKERIALSEFKDTRINHLELKVEKLENCCRWSTVLEQLLPPLAQAELDVMVEQLKQRKAMQ